MLLQELDAHNSHRGASLGSLWDQYVQAHPASTCYHDRAWQTVAERAYHLKTHFLIARDSSNGPVRGIFPLFEIRGPFYSHVSNGLFGAYAPVLGDSLEVRTALLKRMMEIERNGNWKYVVLKTIGSGDAEQSCDPLLNRFGFIRLNAWVVARLKLASDPETMWLGLRDKIRNCVRKAQKHQLEIRSGSDQVVPFYDVLAENMHQKGTPIYGLRFMKELVSSFEGRSEVITIWHEGKVISGALTLFHHKTVVVPFASSRPSALSMSPNNLLYWEIIRRGCERGMETLDFGRSLRDSGALAFKLGWGATVQDQPCHIYTVKELEIDPDRPRVDWFVNRWKKLPRSWADALGPVVCRQVAGLL